MGWIAPEFAQYPLGAQYTAWLYGCPQSNPDSWDKPHLWESSGVVQFRDRELHVTMPASGSLVPFVLGAGGNTVTTDFDMSGGNNCIVFSRFATVHVVGEVINAQALPTQMLDYILIRQFLVEGDTEIEDTAVSNAFGTGWAPQKFPVPMTWDDNQLRQILLCTVAGAGFAAATVVVNLGWKIAYLNTGR